jgi:hypothetical protein
MPQMYLTIDFTFMVLALNIIHAHKVSASTGRAQRFDFLQNSTRESNPHL